MQHNPGPLVQYDDIPGALGRFAGFLSVLIGAAYAFLGTEIVGITASETANPRKTIPIAIQGVWIRILLFYILGTFVLGLICPSNDLRLSTHTGNAASSAWVIAIQRSGIKVLPHIINACILSKWSIVLLSTCAHGPQTLITLASAWSAGSSDLYTSSRTLYGLAKNGHVHKVFTRKNSWGTPWVALLFSASLGTLAYMSVAKSSSTAFGWFSNMSSVAGMFNWLGICITAIRFRRGLKAQNISPEKLPWHSKLVPYAAWWGVTWSTIIILCAKWEIFLHGKWDTASFITNYLPIPVFFCLFFGYKFWYKTKWIRPSEMDFVTDIDEGVWGYRENATPVSLFKTLARIFTF